MSQHTIRTHNAAGQPVQVLLGFDRPLGHVFLVVEGEAANDGYLYSNLDDKNAFGRDLDYYRAKLAELNINVPESMFEQVTNDSRNNVGNRSVEYQPDGSFRDRA